MTINADTPVKAASKPAARLASAEVLESLKYSNLNKAHLDELVKLVVGLDELRLRPLKVFPKGIPVPDGVVVHAILGSGELDAIANLLRTNRRIDGIHIFPRGIPVPDFFIAEIGLR